MLVACAVVAVVGTILFVAGGWDGRAYEVQGDVIMVNNVRCAMTGAPIHGHDLGRWQSRVVYDGPVEHLRGKTLVFNQCCAQCIEDFPERWRQDRDEIVRELGLLR